MHVSSRCSLRTLLLGTSLGLLASLTACRQPQTAPASLTPAQLALKADANAGKLAILHWPNFPDYEPAVRQFYAKRNFSPAWIHGDKPTAQAIDMAKAFANSDAEGLNPADYDTGQWEQRAEKLRHASDADRASFDTAMTVSAMRYLSDLHNGRTHPEHFGFGIELDQLDLATVLAGQIVSSSDVAGALAAVEPTSTQYHATKGALQHYRFLAAQNPDLPQLAAPAAPLSPGQHYASAAALSQRLVLLGDMQPGDEASGETYTQALAAGVRSFQSRHAMPPSGKLTPATVVALNVPLAQRANQLADTLERWRWLPAAYQQPRILVNLPEYLLRAYNDDRSEAFEMKVVVGQAKTPDHNTPMLAKMMRYLVFRPYWIVTPTIIKEEIAPHAAADPSYIEDKNFEVISRNGKPVTNWTADALAHNRYMVREKPGPQNSLGLVKFMLPNKLNIYLHSTPAMFLFDRPRRDYSHGCVRLQDAEKMANWVLADQKRWTADAIHDAMFDGDDNKTVGLIHPLPVVVFYATARVGDDGRVYFFNDIYGYDQDMEATFAAGDPFPTKPEVKKDPNDTV